MVVVVLVVVAVAIAILLVIVENIVEMLKQLQVLGLTRGGGGNGGDGSGGAGYTATPLADSTIRKYSQD